MIIELKKIIKNIEGKILLIGEYSSEINNLIQKNSNITFCERLSNINTGENIKKGKKSKKVNINKLRERYKKDNLDYLIVEYDQIKEYKNTFVRDSIYIGKNKIYLILPEDDNRILKMYKRYTTNIDVVKNKDGLIACIDIKNTKNKFIKEKFYYVLDNLIDIADIISNLLAN